MAKKVTSAKVASKASKALSDGRSSARTKSIAGSALSVLCFGTLLMSVFALLNVILNGMNKNGK